VTSADSASE